MRLPVILPLALLSLLPLSYLRAQATPTVKQAPPPGIEVPEADRMELQSSLAALGKEIELIRKTPQGEASKAGMLADVEVFQKAVHYALDYHEFFNPKEILAAKAQLALATERAHELRQGKASWTSATGASIHGYFSKIDGSVQPYGLNVPDAWKPGDRQPRPLYLWFHGRGDTLSEVNFIASQLKAKRDFAPAGAFELSLYGRYCNASKFAGEADAFEAIADVSRRYAIDPNRIVVMGFSMGGATVWHMATHHAGRWAAASPGAGFAETEVYAKVYDAKKEQPAWWEQVLYRWYDATDYAANLQNCPLVAYSGEIDPQKQSADMMEAAMSHEGLKLARLVGPQTAHKYEPETKKELAKEMAAFAEHGRDPMPPDVRFVTYSLRYNEMKWILVDGMEQHWERAEIDAHIKDQSGFRITTKNVSGFTIKLPEGARLLKGVKAPEVLIDGQSVAAPPAREAWTASFWKTAGKWAPVPAQGGTRPVELRKKHGLQGPIDDAFMDSFIFVRPTGKPLNEKTGAWATRELERAITEWRRVFRGDARVKNDTAITAEDVASANLVLWGDPSSNAILRRIQAEAAKGRQPGDFPLTWNNRELALGTGHYSAEDHVPILISPNPLNPARYVVLNSSFTFREGSTTSNSLQTPKLPDWAVIDLSKPAPSSKWPGLVTDAGFFDENWKAAAHPAAASKVSAAQVR